MTRSLSYGLNATIRISLHHKHHFTNIAINQNIRNINRSMAETQACHSAVGVDNLVETARGTASHAWRRTSLLLIVGPGSVDENPSAIERATDLC